MTHRQDLSGLFDVMEAFMLNASIVGITLHLTVHPGDR